ncbi:MAG TPA: bifunctional 2-polyprenyl-6-hydroxyphenol methylase/3-demethylubiquinol 3-O-methyltransferase UbiG [Bauldia sp.]|nr:bifunctional 2-polyprenyl-6-hydroxyphenol methylase/3-demethylubiquinol 3-O-methyltransferase UbiG [Bauldia sp.]
MTGGHIDAAEVARFAALAAEWWDPAGPFAPLHKLNPLRLGWIKEQAAARFGRDYRDPKALAGLTALDIGCGGGLVAEPLARMGATVTGIDPGVETIAAARSHAEAAGLAIDYRAASVEALAEAGEIFDLVTLLEVVEHVPDVPAFVAAAASLVKPGGLLVASTINRTTKAWLLAIIGAEYFLRWLPRGTHSYDKLVTPAELGAALRAGGLTESARTGVMYVPVADYFRLTGDTDVNYMMAAVRPSASATPSG